MRTIYAGRHLHPEAPASGAEEISLKLQAKGRLRKLAVLAEAIGYLVLARAAVKALPFCQVERWILFPDELALKRSDPRAVAYVCKAVTKCANQPVRWAVCLPQALAGHWMLRRRGIASTICFGLRRPDGDKLLAHAWLCAGGRIVLGGEVASDYTQIAEFPRMTDPSHVLAGSANQF